MNDKAQIIINGTELKLSENKTIEAALEAFHKSLTITGLGDDEHGKFMTASYLKSIDKIEEFASQIPLNNMSLEDKVQLLRETNMPFKPYQEASLVINGYKLESPQSATLRCALESFSYDVYENKGNSEEKKKMIEMHSDSIINIRMALYKNFSNTPKLNN